MVKRIIELTTERKLDTHLVRRERKPRQHVISCQSGGEQWYQFGGLRLPHRLDKLWKWLGRR